ncbi:MAG: hypothetical protein V4576_02445 [Patescibacteria group bacterium]
MYGDIIAPKKKYSDVHSESEERSGPVHFSHIERPPYRGGNFEKKNRKVPFLLLLLALIVVGIIVYHKMYNGTTFTITPKTTRIEIQEKISLVLQSREKDALTYSLVYVPAGSMNGEVTEPRNPFVMTATTTPVAAEPKVTITATSTNDTKRVQLINKSGSNVTLRIATRFSVASTTYTLDAAMDVKPTEQSVLSAIASGTAMYKVIGFSGSSLYDSVYAVPYESVKTAKTVTTTNASSTATGTDIIDTDSVSTVPPADVLALMPDDAIPLIKSTIYDKVIDQSAVVVFDERTLEDFLNASNIQAQDYFKALKPFGASLTYEISVIDYTLITSPDTGKPTGFSSLILEITPKIDSSLVPAQFAGFKKDVVEKIKKQVAEFVTLDVSYSPFWATAVATEEKIKVRME